MSVERDNSFAFRAHNLQYRSSLHKNSKLGSFLPAYCACHTQPQASKSPSQFDDRKHITIQTTPIQSKQHPIDQIRNFAPIHSLHTPSPSDTHLSSLPARTLPTLIPLSHQAPQTPSPSHPPASPSPYPPSAPTRPPTPPRPPS